MNNTNKILEQILEERVRQDNKWGEQNHPILDQVIINSEAKRMCEEFEIPSENRAKYLCEINHGRGTGTYMHILIEEISEVASSGKDIVKMRQELIQTAAVVIAMIESLDRNGK